MEGRGGGSHPGLPQPAEAVWKLRSRLTILPAGTVRIAAMLSPGGRHLGSPPPPAATPRSASGSR